MEFRVNYTLVGLFVVVLVFTTVTLGIWLTSADKGKAYNTYLVYMHESVSGLTEQALVKFNGVVVGYVDSIKINPNNLKQVILVLKIEAKIPITESTVATLKSQGITGYTFVGLEATTPVAPLLKPAVGKKYAVIASRPSLLVRLGDALHDVTVNLNSMTQRLHEVFDDDNIDNFKSILSHMDKVMLTLARNNEHINSSLANVDKLLANTAQSSRELTPLFRQAKQMTRELTDASREVQVTMREGRTTLRQLHSQLVPGVQQLLNQIGIIAKNPTIILRGRQPLPVGPGEQQ